MAKDNGGILRKIPPINQLLELEAAISQSQVWPREAVVGAVRLFLEEVRSSVLSGAAQIPDSLDEWNQAVASYFTRWGQEFHLKPAINATGVIVHTNLGRSPLAKVAEEAVARVSGTYSNLEYDLQQGERGSRYAHVEELLVKVTGAEAGLVVNNNAAAILLALDTLAKGGEAIVSRGELVEIGGSFRVPDVMARSGAVLREVGTTNKTHLRDYAEAINPETKVVLKVHTSNFRILGFSESVGLQELTELAHGQEKLIIEDLGSGVLVDLSKFGLPAEPTVQDSVMAGVDVVTFSGDKLLGGPQAGIIVGKRAFIDRIKKNQLTRALRIDKMTLAALEATLKLYLLPELALQKIPTLRMLTEPVEVVRERAEKLATALQEAIGEGAKVQVVDDSAQAGGGSLPGTEIPSKAVTLELPGLTAAHLERWLRAQNPPVIVRVSQEQVLFNARTIAEEQIPVIAGTVARSREGLS